MKQLLFATFAVLVSNVMLSQNSIKPLLDCASSANTILISELSKCTSIKLNDGKRHRIVSAEVVGISNGKPILLNIKGNHSDSLAVFLETLESGKNIYVDAKILNTETGKTSSVTNSYKIVK